MGALYTARGLDGVGFFASDAWRRLRKWQPGKDIVRSAARQAGIPEGGSPTGYELDIRPRGQSLLTSPAMIALAVGAVFLLSRKRR